jgi:hypothetical protein
MSLSHNARMPFSLETSDTMSNVLNSVLGFAIPRLEEFLPRQSVRRTLKPRERRGFSLARATFDHDDDDDDNDDDSDDDNDDDG